MLIETEATISTGYRKIKVSSGHVIKIVKHRVGVFSYISKDDINKITNLNKHNFSESIHVFNPEVAELIKRYQEVYGIIIDVSSKDKYKILLESDNIFDYLIDPAKNHIQTAQIEKDRVRQEELQRKQKEEETRRKEAIRAREESLRKLNAERNKAIKIHNEKYKWMGPLQILFKPDFRENHCYRCKRNLYSSVNSTCSVCKWMICECGACGCQYGGY